jgi:ketosteroid isomerase-like protein
MTAIDVARKLNEDFNQHDLEALAQGCAEDMTFTDMVSGETNEGPAGFRAYCERWLTAMPDAKIEVVSEAESGDIVYLEFVGRGTHNGPLALPGGGSIPATSRPVEVSFCEALRLREDKVVSGRIYYDGLSLLRQLGIAPALAPARAATEPAASEPAAPQP